MIDDTFEQIELDELMEETEQQEEELITTDSLEGGSPLPQTKSHIKLLLCKGSVFLIGSILIVVAGIVSQYHPPDSIINGNYSECTADTVLQSYI